MTEHAVVIAGGGPTGLMLAGELALAGVDVAIVERRASQDLIGSRAGGLHSRTIEVLDLDTDQYPTGIKYTAKDVDALPITRHDFHGEWNYTLQPTRPKTT